MERTCVVRRRLTKITGETRGAVTERVDQEVVRRFAAGDDAAFSEFYRAYSGPMFCIALRTLGRRDTAADAVQQAFVQAWKAAASFAPEADVAPWLLTITRRTAIDLWRKERRDVLTDDDGVFDEATPGHPWSPLGRRGRSGARWMHYPMTSGRLSGCTTSTA